MSEELKPPCDCCELMENGHWSPRCYCGNIGSAQDAGLWCANQDTKAAIARVQALEAEVKRLIAVQKASERIIETIPSDYIERAFETRKRLPGTGGSHFISHARFCDWVSAVRRAALQDKENER